MTSFGSDSFGSSDVGLGAGDANPADVEELQQFLAVERQKGEMRQQIQMLTEACWDKCVDKPQSKLDHKTESCLSNCAARFIDVSMLIANRFAQALQKQAGM